MSKVQGREGKKRMDPREHVHRGEKKKSYYKSHHRCRWKTGQPGHSERTGRRCSEWRKHSRPQMLQFGKECETRSPDLAMGGPC